jgi:hypothetical protein
LRRFSISLFRSGRSTVSQPCEDLTDENFRRTPLETRAQRSVLRRRRRDRSVKRSGRVESRRFRHFVELWARFLLLRDRPGPGLRCAPPAASAVLPAAPAAPIRRPASAILLPAAPSIRRSAPAARRSGPAPRRPSTGRPAFLTL